MSLLPTDGNSNLSNVICKESWERQFSIGQLCALKRGENRDWQHHQPSATLRKAPRCLRSVRSGVRVRIQAGAVTTKSERSQSSTAGSKGLN